MPSDFGPALDNYPNRFDPGVLGAVVAQAQAPAIIETPGDARTHAEDLAWLRRHLEPAAGARAGGSTLDARRYVRR